jgi:hypothetical protein
MSRLATYGTAGFALTITGVGVPLLLSGPKELGLALTVFGLILLVVIGLVAVYHLIRGTHMGSNPKGSKGPDSGSKSKQITIGKIKKSNVTFGDNSPIQETHIHEGEPQRTLVGKPLSGIEKTLRQFGTRTLGLGVVTGHVESYKFAIELEKLLTRVGWELESGGLTQNMYGVPPTGVSFNTTAMGERDLDPAINTLADWLVANELGPVDIGLQCPKLEINVGPKP